MHTNPSRSDKSSQSYFLPSLEQDRPEGATQKIGQVFQTRAAQNPTSDNSGGQVASAPLVVSDKERIVAVFDARFMTPEKALRAFDFIRNNCFTADSFTFEYEISKILGTDNNTLNHYLKALAFCQQFSAPLPGWLPAYVLLANYVNLKYVLKNKPLDVVDLFSQLTRGQAEIIEDRLELFNYYIRAFPEIFKNSGYALFKCLIQYCYVKAEPSFNRVKFKSDFERLKYPVLLELGAVAPKEKLPSNLVLMQLEEVNSGDLKQLTALHRSIKSREEALLIFELIDRGLFKLAPAVLCSELKQALHLERVLLCNILRSLAASYGGPDLKACALIEQLILLANHFRLVYSLDKDPIDFIGRFKSLEIFNKWPLPNLEEDPLLYWSAKIHDKLALPYNVSSKLLRASYPETFAHYIVYSSLNHLIPHKVPQAILNMIESLPPIPDIAQLNSGNDAKALALFFGQERDIHAIAGVAEPHSLVQEQRSALIVFEYVSSSIFERTVELTIKGVCRDLKTDRASLFRMIECLKAQYGFLEPFANVHFFEALVLLANHLRLVYNLATAPIDLKNRFANLPLVRKWNEVSRISPEEAKDVTQMIVKVTNAPLTLIVKIFQNCFHEKLGCDKPKYDLDLLSPLAIPDKLFTALSRAIPPPYPLENNEPRSKASDNTRLSKKRSRMETELSSSIAAKKVLPLIPALTSQASGNESDLNEQEYLEFLNKRTPDNLELFGLEPPALEEEEYSFAKALELLNEPLPEGALNADFEPFHLSP